METGRVLEILSKQIYDSPYAMVRENLQNAYDAVLMRAKREGRPISDFSIEIAASALRVEIRDDGIGMSEAVLRENFWRAGSSGKNNPEARAAGVIGTFGIGAMANFGVCDRLQVDSREVGAKYGLRTVARKSELTIGADCISMETLDTGIEEGTHLIAEIAPNSPVDIAALRDYIVPFVRFLQVPIKLNGTLLSGLDPRAAAGIGPTWRVVAKKPVSIGRFAFDVTVLADGGNVGVVVNNLRIGGMASPGGLWLRYRSGQVMGLRSRFGLAPLPIAGLYQLGGFADLPFLVPTAGREALTRESIQEAAQLIPPIESTITECIRDTDLADSLSAFQQHVLQLGRIEWSGRVSVQLHPHDRRMELGRLKQEFPGVDLLWYAGSDPETINTFSTDERPLIRVSHQSPKRDVQQRYLREVLKLEGVPDTASISERYKTSDLTWYEVSLTLALASVLRADYLIEEVEIEWVKISHGVSMLTETKGDKLTLRISRTWNAVQAILRAIEGSPELADGLTKDLVRVHIYDKIKAFVPSSQRAGLDALQKTLARRRELYRLEVDDKGELEPLIADYLSGKIEFNEVLTAAARTATAQPQRVSHDSVGKLENVLVDVVAATGHVAIAQTVTVPVSGSPILRLDVEVKERVLTAEKELPHLNNHKLFLALSDKLFQLERDFFLWPHSTQVAWAGRRIVFLFGLTQSGQSLYYDIELKGNRSAGDAGGTPVATTTIVAKNRIFVPVPTQLSECFTVRDSPIEFYVRFDLIGHK